MKAQYGILRFKKYKGPAISPIEAHNERTKEQYASNPDIDTNRSRYNLHLVQPQGRYREEADRMITAAHCRVRKDSVRVVEALVTASPEFFKDKSNREIKAYFAYALKFLEGRQRPDTFLSAVVHMDEKTPHLHLCFVPLTADGRLSAKEIIGNRKNLVRWQDEFWQHMVKQYPELERGESASQTGREHIPPRIFKEMTQLTKQKEQLDALLVGINPFNGKSRAAEISKVLDSYIPNVARMKDQLRKYNVAFTKTAAENEKLKEKNIAQVKGAMYRDEIAQTLDSLKDMPRKIQWVLDTQTKTVQEAAEQMVDAKSFLFLGRHVGYPVAMEGALKLKEIAYTFTEGFAAGELKHGPIALVDEGEPVVFIVPPARGRNVLHSKVISGIEEVKARGAYIIAVAEENDPDVERYADVVFWRPACPTLMSPLVDVVPLQLFAMDMAKLKNYDVDKPRNLAKSVTVE